MIKGFPVKFKMKMKMKNTKRQKPMIPSFYAINFTISKIYNKSKYTN